MINFALTEVEAAFLADIIEMWCEGYAEAKEETHNDPTFESADEFLLLSTSLQSQQTMAVDLKQRLKEATFNG